MLTRTRRRPALIVIVLALALALVAAGCSKSSNKGGGTNPSNEGTPVAGGEVTYGLEADTTGGFCLTSAQLAISGIEVASTIYDTLVVPNQKGDMVPFLAQSVTPNSEATTWTIKLRPNIKFHDGTPLDAEAVKLNLDEYRKGILLQFAFPTVTDVKVVDPLTVEVDLSAPWFRFPTSLWSTGRAGIMAPAQINAGDDCKTKLIGTGPFKIAENVAGQKFVVTKNPNYWLKDKNGVQLPYLDKVTFVFQPDSAQRARSLTSGVTNLIATNSFPQIDNLGKQSGVKLYNEPKGRREVSHLLMNVGTASVFNNQNARLAMAAAVDKKKINTIVNLGKGDLTNGPFDSDVVGATQDTGLPTYDPAKAKQYVAAYKQESGKDLSVRLAATADPETAQIIQLVKEGGEAAGMKVELVPEDQSTLITDAVVGTKFDAFWWRNYPGTDPDADRVWWYSGNLTNFNKINDPQFDEWFVQGAASNNDEQRKQIYTDMNKRFGSQAYNVWGWFSQWSIATESNVNGITGPNLPDESGNPGSDTPYPVFVGWHLLSGTWIKK
ncbi:MAG: ABC transporter substrate-binding protein [Acidimicrobiia bacterium]